MPPHTDPSPAARLTQCALLCAIALTIFMIEAQISPPFAIPGIKLGLSSIVTVYAVFALSGREALLILLGRIFLGGILSGQMMTILYSLGGGLLSWLVLLGLGRVLTRRQLWLASPISAVFHNLGQLLVAALILKSPAVFGYLPYLLIAGICSGLFTGLCAQFLIRRMDQYKTGH